MEFESNLKNLFEYRDNMTIDEIINELRKIDNKTALMQSMKSVMKKY